ncbi:hypothetical protein HDV03_003013 [Kappamyces sp. JEL0829]|nr:hypothetical protein HDV03_003013 [Kappamyces sp. JEL0829]KAJ3358209.1 hypothetical protein HDU91_005279 [Kappamyces sp. JEL0680]
MPTRPQVKFRMIARAPKKPEEPLSNQTSVPGSGMTPIAFPSPGEYEIARGANAVQRAVPAPSMGKSERFQKSLGATPGPGSYRPYQDSGHRSFHLNLGQSWA